jgi:hypothetical protein
METVERKELGNVGKAPLARARGDAAGRPSEDTPIPATIAREGEYDSDLERSLHELCIASQGVGNRK